MSNFRTVKKEIFNYICARTPLIIVKSAERERVERLLGELAYEKNLDLEYYTDAKQVYNMKNEGTPLNIDSDPLGYMVKTFKKRHNMIFAIGDIKHLDCDNSYSRDLLNVLYLAKESSCTVIIVTPDEVWSRLVRFGMITVLDFPDMNERAIQINEFIRTYSGRFKINWDDEATRKAATLLRGFSEIQLENILSAALVSPQGLGKNNIVDLTKQKNRLYSGVSTVQLVEVNPTIKVAGLENLKDWLKEKKNIFFAPDEVLASRSLETPKGILLAGVPGCGKSLSAKMISLEWELPLFRFDLGNVYDKWVGESEKKMKEALDFIDNVSPCVLWIDEIEKALSTSDSGNDTGKRILGQFLFWLQESTSRVFLVATANDVTKLPSELFRKGRFSEMFFIDLPNKEERNSVILYYGDRCLHVNFLDSELETLVDLTKGYSSADIETAIKEVAQYAILNGQDAITFDLVCKKIKSIIPISISNPETIEQCRSWGNERAINASRED